MGIKTAKEIHKALNGIIENTNPGKVVQTMLKEEIDPGISALGALLAGIQTITLIQARALALILEKLEEEAGEA